MPPLTWPGVVGAMELALAIALVSPCGAGKALVEELALLSPCGAGKALALRVALPLVLLVSARLEAPSFG